jgi:hypothetical protein
MGDLGVCSRPATVIPVFDLPGRDAWLERADRSAHLRQVRRHLMKQHPVVVSGFLLRHTTATMYT